jgi:hypothetical protein
MAAWRSSIRPPARRAWRRTNQGETMALIAAAPVAAQPKPVNSVAAHSLA